MREIRPSGSEGGVRYIPHPYPYQTALRQSRGEIIPAADRRGLITPDSPSEAGQLIRRNFWRNSPVIAGSILLFALNLIFYRDLTNALGWKLANGIFYGVCLLVMVVNVVTAWQNWADSKRRLTSAGKPAAAIRTWYFAGFLSVLSIPPMMFCFFYFGNAVGILSILAIALVDFLIFLRIGRAANKESAGVPPGALSNNKMFNEPSGGTPDGARGTRALPGTRFPRLAILVAFWVAVVVVVSSLWMVKVHRAPPAVVLSQSEFLGKFQSNQIAHATITLGGQGSQLTPVAGTYFKTDTNGNVTKEEVPFTAPNVFLTQKVLDQLLASSKVEVGTPNVVLKNIIFILAPLVFLGIMFLLFPGLVIYIVWRLVKKAAANPGPIPQKPDRFWRWFAVAVLAMIAIPILISIFGMLAAIAIPNFVKARAQAQANAQRARAELATNSIAIKTRQTYSSFDQPSAMTESHTFSAGNINFQNVDLKQVLDIYASLSGRNVIRGPLPNVSISLSNPWPLNRIQMLQLFDTVLAENGIAMVLSGDHAVKAVSVSDLMNETLPEINLPWESLPDSSSPMTCSVQLTNLNAVEAVPFLAPLSRLSGSIVAIQDRNLLIFRDYSSSIRQELKLLEGLERRPASQPVLVLTPQEVDPHSVKLITPPSAFCQNVVFRYVGKSSKEISAIARRHGYAQVQIVENGNVVAETDASYTGYTDHRTNYVGLVLLFSKVEQARLAEEALRGELTQTNDISASRPEPPILRFLAWQDEWATNQPGAARHPDGSPVTAADELKWLRNVSAGGVSSGQAPEPRFLHFWFSHPFFDAGSYNDVSLLDDSGQVISPAGNGLFCGSAQEANDANGHLGWCVKTFAPANAALAPSPLTVRLCYTAGPLDRTNLIIVPPQKIQATLEGESMLNGVGQTMDGKAFVSIAVNSSKMKSRKFGVAAVTKDGRDLSGSASESGFADGTGASVAEFDFDTPLADVAKFIIGTRLIRTNEWLNVVLPQ